MGIFSVADSNVTKNRNLWVGGSDMPPILGISKYKNQYGLAREKVFNEGKFEGNEYTEYGNAMEPQIREYINVINDVLFVPESRIDYDHNIRANVDGYEKDYRMLLEIKTHGKRLDKKPYIAQMQLYMYVLGVDHGWLALYERPENFDTEFDAARLTIEVIERDDEYIKKILEAIDTFWIRCEFLKDNPEATEQDYYNFGQNEMVVLSNQLQKLELDLMKYKELEATYKEVRQKLYVAMEEYDIKKYETDSLTITRVLPTTSETFDSAKFKKENPGLASQYVKTSKKAGFVKIVVKEEK